VSLVQIRVGAPFTEMVLNSNIKYYLGAKVLSCKRVILHTALCADLAQLVEQLTCNQ
jgi:hypothetical protein